MTAPALVQKLWNYCNVLRDDGLSCGDYVGQLAFLHFLKMADEQSRSPYNKPSPIPKGFGWDKLVALDGDDLELSPAKSTNRRFARRGGALADQTHDRHTPEDFGKRPDMLEITLVQQLTARVRLNTLSP